MEKTKRNRKDFLKTFFKKTKEVGAIAPSSRFLVKKMCDKIDFNTAKTIIELGPGTGVFTWEILKRARKDAKIIVLELNDEFYNILKEKFDDDRIILLHRSADELEDILNEYNIESVDAVLSSLPLAVIPNEIGHKIIKTCEKALIEGGKYIQYQYSLNSKKMIGKYFSNLKLSFSTMNIPPAFIYVATK